MAGGATREAVARRFGISPYSAWRHWNNHVHEDDKQALAGSPATLANLAELAAKESMSVLEYLAIFRCRLFRALEATSSANDNPGINRTVQTLLQVMDRIGDLTGEIARAPGGLTVNVNSGNTTNTLVMADPLIVRLQSVLLRALAPFPDARAAVIKMLSQLEADEYRPPKLNGAGHALPAPVEIEAVANVG
jgi:hypothetical protein